MKVLVLGSTGFAGKNILECLSPKLSIIKASRTNNRLVSDEIHFDFFNRQSWDNILNVSPDIIINAAAYGVIKNETDIETLYSTNYFLTAELFDYLYQKNCKPYWLQLGTAFEYDLRVQVINEDSPCLPKTHYGISKLMMSLYLLNKGTRNNFCILRPFGMFGKHEDDSKFFPYLINAQKNKIRIDLSPGTQQRDYIYVKDLGQFIKRIIIENKTLELPPVLNIGSGKALSFRDYASEIQKALPFFDADLWKWGNIPFRQDESPLFYSASSKANKLGFVNTPIEDAFKETVDYYFSI